MELFIKILQLVAFVGVAGMGIYLLKAMAANYIAKSDSIDEDTFYNSVQVLREVLRGAVQEAVLATQQTVVKLARKNNNGKLKDEDKKSALETAVKHTYTLLTEAEKEDLNEMFPNLEDTIKAHIEEAVHTNKQP